jgi:hypothetical protein
MLLTTVLSTRQLTEEERGIYERDVVFFCPAVIIEAMKCFLPGWVTRLQDTQTRSWLENWGRNFGAMTL